MNKSFQDDNEKLKNLALKFKYTKEEGALDKGREEDAKKIFDQLLGMIKDRLESRIKKLIYVKKIQNDVSWEDVLEGASTRLYNGIGSYLPTGRFMGWAGGAVWYALLDEIEKLKKRNPLVLHDFSEGENDKSEFPNKTAIQKQIQKKERENYEDPGENIERREFLFLLKEFFVKKKRESFYTVLIWKLGVFPDDKYPYKLPVGSKENFTFKEIAEEMGIISLSSTKKEIKAAETKMGDWYQKALILAKEFYQEYAKN